MDILQSNKELFLYIISFTHKNTFVDSFFVYASELMPYIFIALLCVVYFALNKKDSSVYAFFSVILALCFSFLLGLIHYSNRPFVDYEGVNLITHTIDNSFVSDHSTFLFAIAISLCISFTNKTAIFCIFSLALIGAFARVYVGVHYPIDIFGAFVIALIASIIVQKYKEQLQPLNNFIQNTQKQIFTFLHIG